MSFQNNPTRGQQLLSMNGRGAVWSVAYSPDGRHLAGREVRDFRGHYDEILSLTYDPSGQLLATGSMDGTIGVWSVATGGMVAYLRQGLGAVWGLQFSPDGRTLVSSSDDGKVRFWCVALARRQSRLHGETFGVVSLAFSPDGKTLATGGIDRMVRLWSLATRREPRTLGRHAQGIYTIAFAPAGGPPEDSKKHLLWG